MSGVMNTAKPIFFLCPISICGMVDYNIYIHLVKCHSCKEKVTRSDDMTSFRNLVFFDSL